MNIVLAFAILVAWILINFVIGARLDSLDTFLSACQYAATHSQSTRAITRTHARTQDGIGAGFNQC